MMVLIMVDAKVDLVFFNLPKVVTAWSTMLWYWESLLEKRRTMVESSAFIIFRELSKDVK